jgi:predicted dehydrogenase
LTPGAGRSNLFGTSKAGNDLPPVALLNLRRLIKHSLPTAFRQVVSRLERHQHRLGKKAASPAGKLSCGLLGAGGFFNYAYLPALNRGDSSLAISGILARDAGRFREAQRGLRYAAKSFTEADALLGSGVNAALILLPNHLHFEHARRALERGLHVFCEKPLTNNVADALALKALAEKSGRVLMVDFNERFLDLHRVLKKVIAEERVGKITSARAFHNQDLRGLKTFAALRRERTGGGVVHNAGIHLINLFRHWFGEPESVRAVFENRALPAECGEDTAHCEFRFPGGVTATLDASVADAADTTYERVQFTGTDGEVASDLKKSEIIAQRRGKAKTRIRCKPEIIADSVFNALEHFADCVKKNLRPETGVEDFIKTMKIVEALTLSAQRGTAVDCPGAERSHAG